MLACYCKWKFRVWWIKSADESWWICYTANSEHYSWLASKSLTLICLTKFSLFMVYSYIYIETGEIHQYIKAMRQIDLMSIMNKREVNKMLSPQVPVRDYKLL